MDLALLNPNAALAPTGWQILSVQMNTETGYARVIVECRDPRSGVGRQVLLHRSSFKSRVLEERSTTRRVSGFAQDFWEIDMFFGRRFHANYETAFKALAAYITDNAADPKALSEASQRAIPSVFEDLHL